MKNRTYVATIGTASFGAVLLVLAGCGNKGAEQQEGLSQAPDSIEAIDGGAQTIDVPSAEQAAEAALETSTAFLAANAEKEGIQVTESGLQYLITEPGTGRSPKQTDIVTVHYKGTKINGQEFDSSFTRGDPVTFPLSQVVPGWTEGLQLLKEGSKAMFFLPPELAYGPTGTPGGPIGPNEALIFDVELIEVIDPETDTDRLAEVEAEQRQKIEALMSELSEKNLSASQTFFSENGAKDGIVTTDTGLQYEVISKGEIKDTPPTATDVVKVHYHGTLLDGTVFDSSVDRGEPVEFGLDQVISGWTEGLQLMNVGDKFRFFIPPELAYGTTGNGPIEPNSALMFEVELLGIVTPEAEAAPAP